MTQVAIDVVGELEEQINLFRALNAMPSKGMAIELILKEYFKKNKINADIKPSKEEIKNK